jgi:molecular chaperone DnaJ
VAVAIEIELIDAAHGLQAPVRFEVVERCESCHGNGAEPGTPIETCARCGGAGQLQAVTRTPFGQMVRAVTCDVCHGDGRVASEPCHECRGHGRVKVERSTEVAVPAGIADGQRIRVSAAGHAGDAGAPAGDLYVLVNVRSDERFVREGDDLITVLPVAAPLAALGASLEVATLQGDAPVQVPAGTQSGEVITLRGKGMPALRRGRHGDLRVVVDVVTPRRLNDEQRELLQRLNDSLGEENLRSDESLIAKLRRVLRGQAA